MKTQNPGAATKQPTDVNQLSEFNVAQILNDENITLKGLVASRDLTPSQALVVYVFKQNIGKFVHTYIFRKEGSSHPAQRINEVIDKGAIVERYTGTAIDQSCVEHDNVGYYRLKWWKAINPLSDVEVA